MDHGGVVPVVVQRQMVGETLLLVLFTRKSLFLEPLSDSPSRWLRVSHGGFWTNFTAFSMRSGHGCEVVTVPRRFGVVDIPVIMQRRLSGSRNTWFDSGYMFCVTSRMAFGRIPGFSTWLGRLGS